MNFREQFITEGSKELVNKIENFAFDAESGGFELFDAWVKKNAPKLYNNDMPDIPGLMSDKELKQAIKDLGL